MQSFGFGIYLGYGTSSPPQPLWLSDPGVGKLLQNRKHDIVFELGLGGVCLGGLCPKVGALLSSNVWVLVAVRLSKQTQLRGAGGSLQLLLQLPRNA